MATATFSLSSGVRRVTGGRDEWYPWRSDMVAGEWKQVANGTGESLDDRLTDLEGAEFNPNSPSQSPYKQGTNNAAITWTSSAWDEDRLRLMIRLCGHGDNANNGMYSCGFDEVAPTFQIRRLPTGVVGNEGTLNDGQESTGIYFDGRPRSGHTYNNPNVIDGDFYLTQNGAQYSSGGNSVTAWKYPMSSEDWTQLADPPAGSDEIASAIYDEDSRKIYVLETGTETLKTYDIDADSWVEGTLDSWGVLYTQALLDTGYKKVLRFDSRALAVIDIDPWGTSASTLTTSGTGPSTTAASGGYVKDTTRDVFYHWPHTSGRENLFRLTPPVSNRHTSGTWVWDELQDAAGNTVVPEAAHPQGTHGRIHYSEFLDAVILMNSADQIYVRAMS